MKPTLLRLAFLSVLQICNCYVYWPCEDTDGRCREKADCIADGGAPLRFVREKRSCPAGLFCCQPPYNEDPCESELKGVCMDHQRCMNAGWTPVVKMPGGGWVCPSQPSNIICCTSPCGLPHVKPRMESLGNTHGNPAVPHSWPWQVLLGPPAFKHCGGALITKRSVLTAAHCVENNIDTSQTTYVKLGKHNHGATDAEEQTLPVEYPIIYHPRFRLSSKLMEFDFAIVNLRYPAELTDFVQLVCLPNTTDTVPVGEHCYAAGWGFNTKEQRVYSTELRQALLPIISRKECAKQLNGVGVLHSSMICAGGIKGSPNMCRGDSGAPLVCRNDKGIWHVFGVLSWGEQECLPDAKHKPDAFSNVAAVRDWIWQNAVK